MSKINPVRPEDVLPDDVNNVDINGKMVRKGTIAAFLANTDILENPNASAQQKQEAITMMKELASGVIAIGLHKHVIIKNSLAEQNLLEAK